MEKKYFANKKGKYAVVATAIDKFVSWIAPVRTTKKAQFPAIFPSFWSRFASAKMIENSTTNKFPKQKN